MALITLVNNINYISGNAAYPDAGVNAVNQGSWSIYGSSSLVVNDLSSSFDAGMWTTLLSASFYSIAGTGPMVSNDMSSSFDISQWGLVSGTYPNAQNIASSSYVSYVAMGPFPSTVSTSTSNSTTFILRGFYVAGGKYEFWTSTSREGLPPSGHTLIDVTVIGEIKGGTS